MENRTLYDVGCSYPELCRKNSLGVGFGKRSGDRGHLLCHRCCDESECNAYATCDDDSNDHKLQCLSCSGVESADKCYRNITCATNEVCFLQKYQTTFNKTLFDLGCKRSTMCLNGLQSNVLGRSTEEEKHLLCETCCNGDSICNRDLVCSHHNHPSECADILFNSDGVFNIYPKGNDNPVPVYCKLENGTKWTVIQRRTNGSVDFYKTWNEYKKGFGNVHGEYWLGNDVIHNISSNGRHKLRIFLGAENGTTYIAEYSTFRVGDENTNYLINVTGYSGSAGDSMDRVYLKGRANGFPFSTMDKDNDNSTGSCAEGNRAGWWYSNCCYSDLNENYYTLQMRWIKNIGVVKKSRMMITKY